MKGILVHCALLLGELLVNCTEAVSSTVMPPSVVINTWSGPFESATKAGYETLSAGGSSLDAVEAGCSVCENEQCDTSVGYGNHVSQRDCHRYIYDTLSYIFIFHGMLFV